jgi:type IV pilus assembly protein PilB
MTDENRSAAVGEELVKQDVITREDLAKAREREVASGTPWYRHLLQKRKMSFGVLEDLLRREFHPKSMREEHQRLGETLVRMRAISQQQLVAGLAEQARNGRLLGNILLENGSVTRETLTKALSKQYGLEYASITETPSDPAALEAVAESVARKTFLLPVTIEGDKLTVLIINPQARETLEGVGVLLGKRIYPILTTATADDMRAEIASRYQKAKLRISDGISEKRSVPVFAEGKKVSTTGEPKRDAARPAPGAKAAAGVPETNAGKMNVDVGRFDEIAREASGAPVIKLVSTIIEGAINSGATDIHLDPQQPDMRVRYRIDGILHDVMSIPMEVQHAVLSRIKIMSDMDITETRHPQDGHIGLGVHDTEYDIRVATLPTILGERIVLRLLDQSSVLSGIHDLGLELEDEKTLRNLISQPYGMILVTGPTGSGKTTTLYAALNQKNVMTDSIVTLEDPVEYQFSGINQVQIDTDIEVTFAKTLRAALRQDIDVLLVGEIRDADTARTAIRAAMTGHLVFSTLHTNDAPEAIATLRNMGVPSYLIASALTAVIAQRLVRKICSQCKTSFLPSKSLLKEIGLPESTKKLYRGKGCEACYQTGCKGRTGVFEILDITPDMRRMIGGDEPIERIVATTKFRTMADQCRMKVKEGIIAPEEFVRTIRI